MWEATSAGEGLYQNGGDGDDAAGGKVVLEVEVLSNPQASERTTPAKAPVVVLFHVPPTTRPHLRRQQSGANGQRQARLVQRLVLETPGLLVLERRGGTCSSLHVRLRRLVWVGSIPSPATVDDDD